MEKVAEIIDNLFNMIENHSDTIENDAIIL